MTENKGQEIINKLRNNELTAAEAAKLFKESQKQENVDDKKTIFCSPEWKTIDNLAKRQKQKLHVSTLYIGCSEDLYKILTERTSGDVIHATWSNYKEISSEIQEKQKHIDEVIISPISEIRMGTDKLIKEELEIMLDVVQWFSKLSDNSTKTIYYCYPLSDDDISVHASCIAAFLQSVHLENKLIDYKVIGVSKLDQNIKDSLLIELDHSSIDRHEVIINEKAHYYKALNECNMNNEKNEELFKQEGVYIITGGAGKLGDIFAFYIARKYKNSKIILVGRSKECKNPELLSRINATQSQAEYFSSDISKKENVEKLIQYVKSKFERIDGVIHFAGLTKDALYINKKMEDIMQVLSPKVFGIDNLDQCLKEEKLDFILLNSSTTSILGNIGQCDYAYANRYLDEFAVKRNKFVAEGKRYGKTISINWPLWNDGGIVVDDNTKEWMKKVAGFEPINETIGLRAFEKSIQLGYSQVAVMYGDVDKIRINFFQKEKNVPKLETKVSNVNQQKLYDETSKLLKKILSTETRLPVERISETKSFGEYGIDSIMTVNMTRILEEKLGELPKTLFYEYQNMRDLTGYFVSQHKSVLIQFFQLEHEQEKTAYDNIEEEVKEKKKYNRFTKGRTNEELTNEELTNGNTNSMTQNDSEEDIAIIGVSGRYPMAANLDEFWENLKCGRDSISEIPLERWDYRKFYTEEKGVKGKSNGKWGGFIDDVDKFDSLFFHITPLEAQHLDPQERLFLQTAWHTIEDSGYKVNELCNGNVGVFVGVMYGEYQLYGVEETMKGNPIALGSSYASVANRVSYNFNFHGPSITLDTMCSSSLTSIHLACQSIRKGECQAAIAGGVNISIHPNKYMLLGQTNFLDSRGRCYSFGTGGDGYVPGEGVGAILLKPLAKAKFDKDHIYAVIKASEINHGGKTSGYTVPNPVQQGELIATALEHSNINPRTVNYIEAHGTGTALGDPIEIAGLNKAFCKYTSDKQFCAIGSVKSNIGHLESAAGIAAITKVLLQMKYKKLVPSIHSEALNSNIDFVDSPFYVQQELQDWKKAVVIENNERKLSRRRAGVSSFGAGGSNAHIILEEYEEEKFEDVEQNYRNELIILSAKDKERLNEYANEMLHFLDYTYHKNEVEVEQNPNGKIIELNQFVDEVLEIVSNIMDIDKNKINVDDTLEEYGIDTINLSEVLNEIDGRYQIDYPMNFYDRKISIRIIADYLYQQILQRPSKNTVDHLDKSDLPSLKQIAYTLQAGRMNMEEKLAIIADNIDDLYVKLKQYLNDEKNIENVFTGNIDAYAASGVDMLLGGESGKEFVRTLIVNRELHKLAQLYINGIEIDWKQLYEYSIPNKIALPLYPFAKERCWYETTKAIENREMETIENSLRTFLNRNVSSLTEQKYETVISLKKNKNVSFAADKQNILMQGVLIEMAWEAAEDVLNGEKVQKVKNLEFHSPVTLLNKDKTLLVEVKRDSDNLNFEICSDYGEDKKVVYSNGVLETVNDFGAFNKRIDIGRLQKECDQHYSKKECYEALRLLGYQYEQSQQYIENINIGDNTRVLSEIADVSMDDDKGKVLEINPYTLEAVFQTIFASINMNSKVAQLSLILKIDEICRYQPVENAKWIYVENADSYILDAYGNVLAELIGIKSEKVEPKYSKEKAAVERFFKKEYKESLNPEIIENNVSKTVVILTNDDTTNIVKKVEDLLRNTRIVVFRSGMKFDNKKVDCCTMNFLKEEQGEQAFDWLRNNYSDVGTIIDLSDLHRKEVSSVEVQLGKIRFLQKFVKQVSENTLRILHITKGLQNYKQKEATLAGSDIAGLVKMLGSEYGKVQSKTVDIDIDIDRSQDIANVIYCELRYQELQPEICYRSGQRYVTFMKELDTAKSKGFSGLKVNKDKVVVITGGTRGIGALMANELVEKGFRKLVLMGVQVLPLKEEWNRVINSDEIVDSVKSKIRFIQKLEEKGAKVEVYTGSLGNKEQLENYFEDIRESFGEICGVIHCAGATNMENPAFFNKSIESIKKVLEPKIEGLQVLHEVFLKDNLQFFVLFSSIAGVIPTLAVGNSDYAAANDFMNSYVNYLSQKGHTYYKSINWPSWKEVGMGEVKSPIYSNLGLVAIDNKQGISLFCRALEYDYAACITPLVVNDDTFSSADLLCSKIELKNKKNEKESMVITTKNTRNEYPSKQETAMITKLKDIFSKELGIPVDKLKVNVDFTDFGVDSIIMAEIMKKLEDVFKIKIEPTTLIEYSTLSGLAGFLESSMNIEDSHEEVTVIKENISNKTEEDNTLSLEFATRTLNIKSKEVRKVKTYHKEQCHDSKIAVIGMACDFPKAKNIDEFWNNLRQGLDCITEVPSDRWDVDKLFSEEREQGKSYSKWAGFINGFEYFDADYFKVNKDDAQYLHPLIRLVLENSVQTLRDAGYENKDIWGKKVGIFMGARMMGDYASRSNKVVKMSVTGTAQNFVAAYLSQFLNSTGPSMVVDTACSSSLVSIHLACQSLMTGESEMALAGGVDLLLDEKSFLLLSETQALSPDGKCHTFDEKANGFVLGEGCGCVMLKPLDKAINDHDHIYAVIDSSAINNDGNTMGITTPNPKAQQAVIFDAMEKANINANSIGFVEAHGTGTMIGDPIELRALTNAFKQHTTATQYCGIGSVKTNIGHLLSAAGVASFIKTVLCIQNKKLVSTLNCETPNPRFHFKDSPFYPVTGLMNWEAREGVHRAGISSLGFGGTNAHIIISDEGIQNINTDNEVRKSLPPQDFNKKRYWLEKDVYAESEVKELEVQDRKLDQLPIRSMLVIEESDEFEEFEEGNIEIPKKRMLEIIDETEE